MNLIEELGGYEKAKETLMAEQRSKNIDPVIYINGDEVLMDVLDDALLDYRRQHNIFEVNDQVVLINKPGSSSSLHRVLAVNAPTTIQVCPINQVSGNDLVILGFMASPYYLRHVTDAEFAANRRLEGL